MKYYYILLTVLLGACSSTGRIVISEECISEDKMTILFEKSLKQEFGKSCQENYTLFLEKMKINSSYEDFYAKMNFLCPLHDTFQKIIIESNDSLNIWYKTELTDGSEFYTINFAFDGLFNKWLAELSEEMPPIAAYKKSMNQSHSISPTLTYEANWMFLKTDLSNYKVRRIIASHYLFEYENYHAINKDECQ